MTARPAGPHAAELVATRLGDGGRRGRSFLAWQAAETLLLIFAGIRFGVLLDALARLLRTALPLPHGWALAVVCVALGLMTAATVTWSGYALTKEWDQLSRILTQQFDTLRFHLDNLGETMGAPRNSTADGQMITMVIVGVSIAVILAWLGVPGAVLLGVQAALVNFIPYLGPLLAAVPVLLAAASQGAGLVWWVLGACVVVQAIEGYVLTPLVQKRAVHISPVLTLVALMLFGAVGIAVATPLTAALRIAVLRLYVEDRLQAER